MRVVGMLAGSALVAIAVAWWLVDPDPAATTGSGEVALAGPRDAPTAALESRSTRAPDLDSTTASRVDASEPLVVEVRRGGAPLANALVRVIPWEPLSEARSFLEPLGRIETTRPFESRTDVHGLATLPEASVPRLVGAHADGAAPAAAVIDPAATRSLVLELGEGLGIHGHVRDAEGAAIAGARVGLSPPLGYAELARLGTEVDPQVLAGWLFAQEAFTGDDGAYEIRGLAAGPVEIVFAADGYVSQCGAIRLPESRPCDVTLAGGGGTIRGTVRRASDGRPVRGAHVTARTQAMIFRQGWTDASGRFELHGCGVDVHGTTVIAVAPGLANEALVLESLRQGEVREVVLELGEACGASGIVRSTTGEVVPDARICLRDVAIDTVARFVFVDSEGRFEIDCLRPGRRYSFEAFAGGYVAGFLTVESPCEQALSLELIPCATMRGRILVDAYPLAGAAVRLIRNPAEGGRVTIDAAAVDPDTGAFAFDEVVPGGYRIEAKAAGFARSCRDLLVEPAAEIAGLDVELDRGATLRGAVALRGSGAAVEGASVALVDTNRNGTRVGLSEPRGRTDASGHFILEHVPTGVEIRLEVEHERTGREHEPMTIGAGEIEAWVDVEVELGAMVRVSVVDVTGRTVPAFSAAIRTTNDTTLRGQSSAGRVEFSAVPPGAAKLFVNLATSDGRQYQRDIDVRPGRPLDVEERIGAGGRLFGTIGGDGLGGAARSWYVQVQALGAAGASHVVRPSLNNHYELSGLDPGSYWLRILNHDDGEDLGTMARFEMPANGEVELNFVFPAAGVEGVVRGLDGAPATRGSVYVRREEEWQADGTTRYWRSAAVRGDGRYAHRGLEPGRYELWVSVEGLGCAQAFVDVGDDVVRRDFTLAPEGRLEIVSRDTGGAAPRDVTTNVYDATTGAQVWPHRRRERLPDVHVFERLGEGRYEVRFSSEEFFPAVVEEICRAGETTRGELTLRRRGDLVLTLADAAGRPRPREPFTLVHETGASVVEWIESGDVASSTGGTIADGEGRVELRGLAEGRYRLDAGGAAFEVVVVAREVVDVVAKGS